MELSCELNRDNFKLHIVLIHRSHEAFNADLIHFVSSGRPVSFYTGSGYFRASI